MLNKFFSMPKFKNLILIDDDVVANYLHQWWAEKMNLAENIVSCCNPKQAIGYVDKNGFGITPDLMLIDINMPVMNGLELLEELFSNPGLIGSKGHLLMLTSSSHPSDYAKAHQFPISGWLTKPLDETQVQKLIQLLESQVEPE
jgi:CheY-like chemotaxis protein